MPKICPILEFHWPINCEAEITLALSLSQHGVGMLTKNGGQGPPLNVICAN